MRAGDDAFEAHHTHALTAFARLSLKHDTELARRNAGQFISMLGLCRSAVKGVSRGPCAGAVAQRKFKEPDRSRVWRSGLTRLRFWSAIYLATPKKP